MARKKRRQLINQISESLKKKFDDANIRDIVYFGAYVSAVHIAYEILTGRAITDIFFGFRRPPVGMRTFPVEEEQLDLLQFDKLAVAMIAGYLVLKIDVEDVVSATTTVTSWITGLKAGSMTPAP